jgi:hypothetical protein
MKQEQQFNYFDYTTVMGVRLFAVAATNAMPRKFHSILFTGTYEECMLRLDPPGLEGSFEDQGNKVAFRA